MDEFLENFKKVIWVIFLIVFFNLLVIFVLKYIFMFWPFAVLIALAIGIINIIKKRFYR
jgi:hypothetical protein